MPLVHVHLRAGRSAAERRAILDGVHAVLVEALPVHEPPLASWGIRGGQAATDVQLGFKVDV